MTAINLKSITYRSFAIFLLLIIVFGVYFIIVRSASDRLVDLRTIQLQWENLWDPEDPNLADWKAFKFPKDMIAGPKGELIIADTDNSRVIRFTTHGELVEVVGSKGEGPGELLQPHDLAYDPDTNILWVIERGLGRTLINRFRIEGRGSQFIASSHFQALEFSTLAGAGAVASGSDSVWISSRVADQRIRLFNSRGQLLKQFGDIWVPNVEDLDRGKIMMYNLIFLEGIWRDSLAAVWSSRPYIELWDFNGTLLQEAEIKTPEIDRIASKKRAPKAIPIYFYTAAVDPNGKLIYCISPYTSNFVIYGISPITLLPEIRFVCKLPMDSKLQNLVVLRDTEGVYFYGFDLIGGGVLKFTARTSNE